MRRHVQARREWLRELAQRDAEGRCAFCRKALVSGYLTHVGPDGVTSRYCDEPCRLDHVEAVSWQEGR